MLLVALGYSMCAGTGEQGYTLPKLCLGLLALFSVLLGFCFFTEWEAKNVLLRMVLLFLGVENTLASTFSIWADCIHRDMDFTDASQYAKLMGCCSGKTVGMIWLTLSVVFAGAMLFLALLLMAFSPDAVPFEGELSPVSLTCIMIPAALLCVAVVWRILFSNTYQAIAAADSHSERRRDYLVSRR
jgi:hypothetical protein